MFHPLKPLELIAPRGSKIFRWSLFLFLIPAIVITNLQRADAAGDKKIIYAVLWTGCEELCRGFQDYLSERNINTEIIKVFKEKRGHMGKDIQET